MRRRFLPLALLALASTFSIVAADDKPSAAAAGLLPAKSRWRGTEAADETHAHSPDRAIRFHVTKRTGERFEADFWIDREAAVSVRGRVDANGQINCVPMQVLKGKWQRRVLDDHWHGKATAEKVTLTRPLGNGGEKTSMLMPAKDRDDDGDAEKPTKK